MALMGPPAFGAVRARHHAPDGHYHRESTRPGRRQLRRSRAPERAVEIGPVWIRWRTTSKRPLTSIKAAVTSLLGGAAGAESELLTIIDEEADRSINWRRK